MKWAIVLAGFAFASAAHAQTTTCTNYVAHTIQCQTQPSFQAVPPIDYSSQLRPVAPVNAGLQAYQDARARSRQQLVAQVAPLMAAGQCETARMMAIQQRDNELAELIYTTCKPAP